MQILLTGSTGFIGKHFLSVLIEKNYTIRVLVRDKKKLPPLPSEIQVVTGDLTQPNSLLHLCDDIDAVFHLAGHAHAFKEKNASDDQHHAINFQGTQNLLHEAIRARVKKFIFFSSVKAVADSQHKIDETWQEKPSTPYGIAKQAAENLVLNAQSHGLHVTVLRPALVYGPEWKGNLASMLRAIDKGLFPPLPETYNKRSMISINDLCQAALLATDQPQANGKIYFVTDSISYSTRQLYILMKKALAKPIPHWHIPLEVFKLLAWIGDAGGVITRRRLPFNSDAMEKLFGQAQYDSTRITQELGFKPKDTLEKLLPHIITVYRAQSNKEK